MRRALLITAALALAPPAAAPAKTGLEFDRSPESSKVGAQIPFTMQVYREPRAPGGRAHPVVGIHPLVTFKSQSGRVVRVRAHRTSRFGVAHGSVAFPDRGPWVASSDMKTQGVHIAAEWSQPITVGSALARTSPPPADAAPDQATHDAGSGFSWLWVLAPASIAAALAVVARRRHWGPA